MGMIGPTPGRQYSMELNAARILDKGKKGVHTYMVEKAHPEYNIEYQTFNQRISDSYFKGWSAVADYDKQAFLKAHPEAAKLSGDDMDNFFRNQIFTDIFKNSTDDEGKEIWANAANLSRGDRDNIVARRALEHDIDGISDNQEKSFDFLDTFFDPVNAAKQAYAKGAGQNTLRHQAERYLDSKSVDTTESYKRLLMSLSPTELEEQLTQFDKLSSELSGYFREYSGTDKLKLTQYDKINLLAKFMANQEVGGGQFAARALGNYYQDTVAENQGALEKIQNAGAQFIDSAGGMIVRAAGMVMGLTSLNRAFGYNEDASYWENIINNDVTRYGDRIATTNVWFDTDKQKQLEETGMSDNQILNTVEQQQSILSWNTPYELFGQYGFTAASTILSFGGSAAIKGLTGMAARGVRLATASKGLMTTERGLQVIQGLKKTRDISNIFVGGMVGMVEGGMNASMTKQDVMRNFTSEINKRYGLDEAIAAIDEDPRYEDYSDEQKMQVALSSLSPDQLQNYNDDMQFAKDAANTAMYQDFAVNSVINGLIHSTLEASLQAPAIQRSLQKYGFIKGNLEKSMNITRGKNGWAATAKEVTTRDIIKTRIKESFGEGLEEYTQDLSSAFASAYAGDRMQQYIANKYSDNPVADATETDVWSSIGAGLRAVQASATDDQSIKSFLYGGLSTLMGGFNANLNMRMGKKREGENTWDYVSRLSPITWRGAWTPLVSHTERDQKNALREAEAERLNKFFADKDVQNALFNVECTSNFMQEMFDALQRGDEKTARDAKLATMFSNIITLNSLSESGYYSTVVSSLQARANFDSNNLQDAESAESKAVDTYLSMARNRGQQVSREEALTNIKKSASDMLDMMERVETETSAIEKIFGEGMDQDVKAAMVYNRIAIQDDRKRIDQLDKELDKAIEALRVDNPNAPTTHLNEGGRNLIARYGSLSNATKRLDELKQKKEEGRKLQEELKEKLDNPETSPKERAQAMYDLNRLQSLEMDINSRIKDIESIQDSYRFSANTTRDSDGGLTSVDSEVLSAQDIMSLEARHRNYMLDPSHRDQYSAEQQAEIDKVNSIGTQVDSDFSRKITDRARLETSYRRALTSQYNYMQNSDALNNFIYEAKKNVERRAYAKKNEYLLDLENKGNYAQFAQSLEKLFNSENSDEIAAVRNMLVDSDFYAKYLQEHEKKREVRDFIDKTDSINMTTENAQLFSVMQDFLSSNGVEATNVQDAVDLLSQTEELEKKDTEGNVTGTEKRLKLQGYIDEINKSLPQDRQITLGKLGDALQMFKDVMETFNADKAEKARLAQQAKPAQGQVNPVAAAPVDNTDIHEEKKPETPAAKPVVNSKGQVQHEDPIVNNVMQNNPTNDPLVNQAEFIVNRTRSLESKYGTEATDMALSSLESLSTEEYSDTDEFSAALMKEENRLLGSSVDDSSVEAKAASILRQAREAHAVQVKKEGEKATRTIERKEKGASGRSLFNRTGSQKYVDRLTPIERQEQEARLARILDGMGRVTDWLSPESNPVITEYLAKGHIVNTVDVRSWKNMPQALKEYWQSMGIDEYLTSHSAQELKAKPVFFYSPNLGSEIEQFADFDSSIDQLLVPIVEDENGKITIGDKRYQPIGVMPRSYDGVHNRWYHPSSVQGTASLFHVRQNMQNVARGEIITDQSGTPIQTRITTFTLGNKIGTSQEGYRSASQVDLENMSAAEREQAKGMTKQQLRGTSAYQRARKRFLSAFVSKGGVTKCFIRLRDNYGRPIGGGEGLSHIHFASDEADFGTTVGRNSDKTLEQVLMELAADENTYSQLYDSTVPYNEGGFNRRTQAIGAAMQRFFKEVFNVEEIANLPDDQSKIAKLAEYAEKLRNDCFVQKRGVYFNKDHMKFVFIPSADINGKPGFTLALRDSSTGQLTNLGEVTQGLLSDKTAAKIMGNMFMDGGQMRRGIRWQVAQSEINVLSEGSNANQNQVNIAQEYIGEMYDDGIIQTAKTRISYEVNQVSFQAPYNNKGELVNPKPIPITVNPANATDNSSKPGTSVTADGTEIIPETGTPINGAPIVPQTGRQVNPAMDEAARIGEFIQGESEDWDLNDDKTGYIHKDKPEVLHARVTSVIAADEENPIDKKTGQPERFDPNSEWATPSSVIGTSVDEFIRDFFDGKLNDSDFTDRPNAIGNEWKRLYNSLQAFKDGWIKDRGLTILSRDVIAHGQLEVTDANGRKGKLNVAGTLDLLAYDNQGNFYVFDMKTFRSSLDEKKKKKYARQVSVYQKLLQQHLASQGIDIQVNSLAIIPIQVNYPDARSYDYMETDGNQLLIRAKGTNRPFTKYKGLTMRLGAEPITMPYHEPNILFEKLTSQEQSLVKWNDEVNDDQHPPVEPPAGPEGPAPEGPVDKGPEKDKGPEPPQGGGGGAGPGTRRRSIRKRGGINLGIGGLTEDQLRRMGQNPMNPQNSLSYLRANNPEDYEIAMKFNESRKDNTAWDKLSDEQKDSYLSCLGK